jgi:YegS/Rv2252/BmrU family lipid kinase
MARRSLCLIANPSAGRGRTARLLPRVEADLRGRGLALRVEPTYSLGHARELARETLERGEIAVGMGGDGLLGAIAGELRGTDGVLGVLPGGRGNDFARKLGVGTDPVAACEVLATGRETAIDVADAGGATYLGIASAGIDSDVQAIANGTRIPLGRMIYAVSTLRALAHWHTADWEVTADGEGHAFSGYSVAVANTGVFGGGMYLVPEASLSDGLLDVVLLRACPRARYLVNLPRVFRGTHAMSRDLTFLRAREVTFSADRPFAAYADGDAVADLPVTIRVVPGALKVLVP